MESATVEMGGEGESDEGGKKLKKKGGSGEMERGD